MKKLIFLFAFLTLITSCGHHRDVRPGTEGVHSISIKTEDKSEGYREASSQATHYCEEVRNQSMAVVSEKYTYTGNMDEETYKRTKTEAKIAKGVGGTALVFGGKKESNAGGIIGLGGQVADSVAGEGYTYVMTFKCM